MPLEIGQSTIGEPSINTGLVKCKFQPEQLIVEAKTSSEFMTAAAVFGRRVLTWSDYLLDAFPMPFSRFFGWLVRGGGHRPSSLSAVVAIA
eukprot:4897096-Amphidinium_carterae.1